VAKQLKTDRPTVLVSILLMSLGVGLIVFDYASAMGFRPFATYEPTTSGEAGVDIGDGDGGGGGGGDGNGGEPVENGDEPSDGYVPPTDGYEPPKKPEWWEQYPVLREIGRALAGIEIRPYTIGGVIIFAIGFGLLTYMEMK